MRSTSPTIFDVALAALNVAQTVLLSWLAAVGSMREGQAKRRRSSRDHQSSR